jgi:acylphosphatase
MSKARAILHVTIRGRVQGVGYRAWVEYQASACHLEGWVRNRRDGSVEALLIGEEAAVTAVIEQCRRGPSHARVDRLDAAPAQDDGSPDFAERATV